MFRLSLIKLCQRLVDALRVVASLGLPGLVESYLFGARNYQLDEDCVRQHASLCEIVYDHVHIDRSVLTRLSVVPKCRPSEINGVILFFQGAKIAVEKTSCLQNVIDMSLRCRKIVMAFNQRHVGISSGYHRDASSLSADLREIAHFSLKKLLVMRQSGVIHAHARLSIYGLCQGGLMASIAAQAICDHPDFERVFISRAPLSFWEMAAYAPRGDYAPLMPQMKKSPSVSWRCWKTAFSRSTFVIFVQTLIIRLISRVPEKYRASFVYWIFRHARWDIDCRDMIKQLMVSRKLHVFAVRDDEFLSERVNIMSYVRKIDPSYAQVSLMTANVAQDSVQSHAEKSHLLWPYDTVSTWRAHCERAAPAFPHHQAWSQCLFDEFGCDEYAVLNRDGNGLAA